MTKEIAKLFQTDPYFKKALEEGLAEQWKYSAEPVFARTGKGLLRSTGVTEAQKVKAAATARSAAKDERQAT